MNIHRKIQIFLIFLLVGGSFHLFAQSPTKRQVVLKAEENFAVKNYYGALVYFDEALEYNPNDADILFKSAEAARLFNAYSKAAYKYQYLLDSLKDDSHPIALFWLANMQQHMGNYEAARNNYNFYLSEFGGLDSLMTLRANKELGSLDFAEKQIKEQKDYIRVQKMEGINTPYSEVGGNIYGDDFYYSTSQYKEPKKGREPGREISKLHKKTGDDSSIQMPGYINERNEMVSNSCINRDGTAIYYTICNYINYSDIHCAIYKSDLDSNGNLSNEVRLLDPINMEGYTSTHPHMAIDKMTGLEMLYFASDRPGGKGGLDIWYSLLDPKFGFSEPINIEKINTPNHEITPFFNMETDFLFFSSDGRESLGGYDIYKSIRINDTYGKPIPVGLPINSSYNDIYYFEHPDGATAYLSSNRAGSFYIDSYFEGCCYDIYELKIDKIELDLKALTFDKITGRPLNNATVTIYDKDTGLELARVTNDEGNEHLFPLAIDRNYFIVAEREDYYPDTISFSTLGLTKSDTIVKKHFLETDKIILDVFAFTKVGNTPLDSVTITLIDLSDPNAKKTIQFNPLSNDFYFLLDAGKEYKIIAEKDGYTNGEEYIDTRNINKSSWIKRNVYLDKFRLPDLLPLTLYFDNDLPDRRSSKSTTNAIFGDLIAEYMSRKEEYKGKYSSNLSSEQRQQVIDAYEDFFEGDIRGGYDKFRLFLVALKQELEAGNTVELYIKGYASPRAESKYNLKLSQRRVYSVKNEILLSDPEIMAYYKSGKLIINDISFGKEQAPVDVSSSIGDERNSIYNLKAAKERRAEILRAARGENKK
ncbi:MAG: hypothetical protein LC107_10400 [Chitinophagales bacterium]|nr:hypothetical protein [Chitinophagales bacterium]